MKEVEREIFMKIFFFYPTNVVQNRIVYFGRLSFRGKPHIVLCENIFVICKWCDVMLIAKCEQESESQFFRQLMSIIFIY